MQTSQPRLVKPREARAICGGLSESTVRRLIAQDDFPKPVVLSRDRHGRPLRVAFVHDELVEWCRGRIAADRGASSAARS